jgi:hydroxymethylglutaryl-CoA reductase (NADPH)
MNEYPIVPGRGIGSGTATALRHKYLEQQGKPSPRIAGHTFEPEQLKSNVESFLGSVEIPVGLVGPLLLNYEGNPELVHAAAATLEGALIASMNRGAKAVSLCGGVTAAVLHQRMVRCPMFIFNSLAHSMVFRKWVLANFAGIKRTAEKYSNHAVLETIQPYVTGKSVHLKFIYTTGDASGQNMTTACTWHAILEIHEKFVAETGIDIVHFVVEGNGASDKKVSAYSIGQGRGVHVVAECNLKEEVIKSVLRTTSEDMVRCFNQSVVMSRLDGMAGYNINVANAVAAIFAATGQDLASIHESACGVLNVEKTTEGLYLSLNLPGLVIGTIGGGTHLPKQKEALELMGCYGQGKVSRFSQIIAGFALALEISTYAAIVSGQFAKAHEKLGRNKPVNWLLRAELDKNFLGKCLNGQYEQRHIRLVDFPVKEIENGIISGLTSRISRKLIGFVPVDVHFTNHASHLQPDLQGTDNLLMKSKPLDLEVIKGLHYMAAAVNPELSDLISAHKGHLEYTNCHLKELKISEFLHRKNFPYMPVFFGSHSDQKREIYVLLQEFLKPEGLALINSENQPATWTQNRIENALKSIHAAHLHFTTDPAAAALEVPIFEPWQAVGLYRKMLTVIREEYAAQNWEEPLQVLEKFLENMQELKAALKLPETIIHNDFNSRNVAIRTDETVCIYDWELAMVNLPHRDVVEFLSFVLEDDFEPEKLQHFLGFHYQLAGKEYPWESWKKGYAYALQEYLVSRVSFYLIGSVVVKYDFAERVFRTGCRMLQLLTATNP